MNDKITYWKENWKSLSENTDELTSLITYCERVGDQRNHAILNIFKGKLFIQNLRLAEGMECLMTALDGVSSLGLKDEEISIMHGLGTVYNYLGDFENRLKCNLRCLELSEVIEDFNGIVTSLINIGDTYSCLHEFKKANDFFNHALSLEITPKQKAILLHNKGEVAFFQKHYEVALKLFLESVPYAESAQYVNLLGSTFIFIAKAYKELKDESRWLEFLQKADEMIDSNQLKAISHELHSEYFTYYKSQGDYKKALEHLELSTKSKDQVLSDSMIQRVKNVEFSRQMSSIQHESKEVKKLNIQLQEAFHKIEEKNSEIKASINYAKLIQDIILPSKEPLEDAFAKSQLFYQPKDILSGDFYWLRVRDSKIFFAIADCTGHGIPGALLSILCVNALNNAFVESNSAADLLNLAKSKVVQQLQSNQSRLKDGMDLGVGIYDMETKMFNWSGANQPLWFQRKGEIQVIKGNKFAICVDHIFEKFEEHEMQLHKGDRLFMFTDGIIDQFGGPKNKKIKSKQLKAVLERDVNHSLDNQFQNMIEFFEDWKGAEEQVDDICFLAVEIP